jgi:hypothetical protein
MGSICADHTLFLIGWLVPLYKNVRKQLRTRPRRKAQDNESNEKLYKILFLCCWNLKIKID